jgi:phospholipid/cholesterol/gamma-HCH transport system substrate-binding protein
MSRTLSSLQAALLGVAVLLGLGLVAGAIYIVAAKQWFGKDALHVEAGFDNAGGVEVGTPVRIQGVNAGEVVSVEPPGRRGRQVMVRLRIRPDFRHLVSTDAVVQIVSVGMLGGKAVEIHPGDDPKAPLATDDTLLASKPPSELTDVLNQVKTTLDDVVKGKGTLGELLQNPKLFNEMVTLVQQAQSTMTAIQADAEAFKRVPVIGKYVEDPQKLLVRPGSEHNVWRFRETDLFQEGRAVLTRDGQDALDRIVDPVVALLEHKDADVVVVAYADPKHPDPARARTVTAQQSEAVAEYLKDRHKIHKKGILARARVSTLGLGTRPPPNGDRDKYPFPRVEVLVFVPQK